MTITATQAGTYTPAGTDLSLVRMGYGAMQLAGANVFGPPKDEAAAIEVLRTAIELGVNHVDTADFYGPHTTNQLIRKALSPYPTNLTVVTKIGCFRGEGGSWDMDRSNDGLKRAVDDNLRNLGREQLDVVNLRLGEPFGPTEGSIAEPLKTVFDLQRQGLIRHVGISTVTADQIKEARDIGAIVCVQNHYNLAHRGDDAIIDDLAEQGIAYVPYFPLGGFSPLQSDTLARVAAAMETTPLIVALAWLLQRSPNILLIPGTSSVNHLRQNISASAVTIPDELLRDLAAVA
ncbi:oxidoreductase (plasmid) [Agrobacterium tumefaciens]|uniref:Oxidoreductase n=1 Tax=Agrobacterium tumefaciens TaxID=358 RepID=A0AAJ4TDC1_AGRTU|nr:oxidoreductase [Agrobacterium tumefaciens]